MKLKDLLSIMDKDDHIVTTYEDTIEYSISFPYDDEFDNSTVKELLKQKDKLEMKVNKIKYMNEYDYEVWFEVYLDKGDKK